MCCLVLHKRRWSCVSLKTEIKCLYAVLKSPLSLDNFLCHSTCVSRSPSWMKWFCMLSRWLHLFVVHVTLWRCYVHCLITVHFLFVSTECIFNGLYYIAKRFLSHVQCLFPICPHRKRHCLRLSLIVTCCQLNTIQVGAKVFLLLVQRFGENFIAECEICCYWIVGTYWTFLIQSFWILVISSSFFPLIFNVSCIQRIYASSDK